MPMNARNHKWLSGYLLIAGVIVALAQVGGCGGGGSGFSANGGVGDSSQYNYSGPWSGTINQGDSLAFTVEEIASYDITSLAYTIDVAGTVCSTTLSGNIDGIVEPVNDNEARVMVTEPGLFLEFIFYFDFANAAHGSWYVEYAPCDAVGQGTFSAGKGQMHCADGDDDGYYNSCGQLDCRNNDEDIHPGAIEICDDGKDNDCDGWADCADGDCFGTLPCLAGCVDDDGDDYYAQVNCGTPADCDDTDDTINPGAAETCNDAEDNDCDGLVDCAEPGCSAAPACLGCMDADGDGYFAEAGCGTDVDCNDSDDSVYPGGIEVCNNDVDDDCDAQKDEGCSSDTIFVPDDYATIQKAIDAASNGDAILIDDNIYYENIVFSDSGKAVTVRSLNGAGSTVIRGDTTASVVTFGSGNRSTLDGFTVTNGASATNGGGILIGSNASPTIVNCIIAENTAAIAGGGIHCSLSSSPLIANSIIRNNSVTAGTRNSNGGGIHVSVSSSPTITDCIVEGNSSQWNGGGMAINAADVPVITNCIFNNNSAVKNGGGLSFQTSAPKIVNSTFSGNSAAGNGGAIAASSPKTETVLTNSIFWGNSSGGVFQEIAAEDGGILNGVSYSDVEGGYDGVGNIDANPLFAGAGDYHLLSGSPCIDKGTNTGTPSTDIDGEVRPQGAGYDMGADERE